MDFTSLFAQHEQQGALLWIDKIARTPLSVVVIGVGICTLIRALLFLTILKPRPAYLIDSQYKAAQFINEACDAVIYAGVFVFLVIRPFVLQTFFIPSGSMVQTLQINDYIVANKFIYRVSDPQDGDIIVFKPPTIALAPGQGDTDFIKRLIGKPGDLIEIKNRVLYRNGMAVEEPYTHYTRQLDAEGIKWADLSPTESALQEMPDFKLVEYQGKIWPLTITGSRANAGPGPEEFHLDDPSLEAKLISQPAVKVPDGYYLMIGDNRNNSFDGRFWGLVPRKSIIGRAEFIWFPLSRMGRTH